MKTQLHVPAARCTRGLIPILPSIEQRAQGKPGARCTRGLACKMHIRKCTRAYRFSGGIPAFPARWFTAYFALSPVTGFLATVPLRILPQSLAPALGRQDHTTSPSAISCARQSQLTRPPHPVPTFVTMANAPLRDRTAASIVLICPTSEAESFCKVGWTDLPVGQSASGFETPP